MLHGKRLVKRTGKESRRRADDLIPVMSLSSDTLLERRNLDLQGLSPDRSIRGKKSNRLTWSKNRERGRGVDAMDLDVSSNAVQLCQIQLVAASRTDQADNVRVS